MHSFLEVMNTTTRLPESLKYIQHGSTSVYEHSVNVACTSLKIAFVLKSMLHFQVDEHSLVRGALLHDYFLYDWHENESWHKWHGFRHPFFALMNAREVCSLTPTEADIIVHHMFPLTLVPPRTLEGGIVMIADKLCALYETFRMNEKKDPFWERRWYIQLRPCLATIRSK
ncbi:MAG TPA: phosphohydrolase [Treponema sp.]|nr:phosphohydrolase [Treponema sp.]